MDSSQLQQILADPQGFFTNPQNYVYAYALIIFLGFTVARVTRIRQSLSVPVVMALLFLLTLVRNGIVALSWPTIFFGLLLVIGVTVGARYFQRLNRPF